MRLNYFHLVLMFCPLYIECMTGQEVAGRQAKANAVAAGGWRPLRLNCCVVYSRADVLPTVHVKCMTGQEAAGRLMLLLVGGWRRLRLQLEVAAPPLQPSRPPDRLLSGGTLGRGGVEEGGDAGEVELSPNWCTL